MKLKLIGLAYLVVKMTVCFTLNIRECLSVKTYVLIISLQLIVISKLSVTWRKNRVRLAVAITSFPVEK